MAVFSIDMVVAFQPCHFASVVLTTQDTASELHPRSSYYNPSV